jgi:hypothetical protein
MVLAPFPGAIPVYEDRDLAFWLHPETYEAIRLDGGGESVDLIRLFHEEADKADTLSKCYFIGADIGPVKIGHSINPKLRLRTIQNYSPVKLRIFALASGGPCEPGTRNRVRAEVYDGEFMRFRWCVHCCFGMAVYDIRPSILEARIPPPNTSIGERDDA